MHYYESILIVSPREKKQTSPLEINPHRLLFSFPACIVAWACCPLQQREDAALVPHGRAAPGIRATRLRRDINHPLPWAPPLGGCTLTVKWAPSFISRESLMLPLCLIFFSSLQTWSRLPMTRQKGAGVGWLFRSSVLFDVWCTCSTREYLSRLELEHS